jgi:AcrR family transcriptional regulator
VARATWWNLPEERRARVTKAAISEFGRRGLSAGSLNVIAREAGIAKGSLFQYFDDKVDLYVTICEHVTSEIEHAVLSGVDPAEPLFVTLRSFVGRWLSYFREHPLERRLSYASMHEVDPDIRTVVRAVPNARHRAAFSALIQAARSRDELRTDVDERLLVSLISVLLRHLNSAPFEPEGDVAIPFSDLSVDEVDRWGRAYVDALEAAFGS